MSDTVIRVENLSKKYLLDHQRKGHRNYKSIKESLPNAISSLGKKILNPRGEKGFKLSQEEFWALKDVSFEIKQGDRVGIIGRNGAGKSTLLKILSRITEPTNGRIGINGRIASLLEVGTGFHPELTGRENIFLNGAVLGMSRVEIQRKFDEIVNFAEVEKFLDTPVKRYSSGMYVRLAFAVAAHLEPEILIVDEVLAVGDAQFQKKCLNKMGEVASEGRTILFVSHNVGAISTLCDKAVFLEKGRVREIGSVEKITTTYMSELFNNKVKDLSELRISGMGKEIRFSDIQLAVATDSNLNFGEPIIYKLTIHSDVSMNDVVIGTSIFTSSGSCVGSLITEQTLCLEANREVTIHLKLMDTNLAPGSYYTGFGLGQKGTQVSFDAVIGKPAFQILPLSSGKNTAICNWQSSWGSICFRESKLEVKDRSNEIFVLSTT
jgi:lipopolysaccharide transport system ATP-binding protein